MCNRRCTSPSEEPHPCPIQTCIGNSKETTSLSTLYETWTWTKSLFPSGPMHFLQGPRSPSEILREKASKDCWSRSAMGKRWNWGKRCQNVVKLNCLQSISKAVHAGLKNRVWFSDKKKKLLYNVKFVDEVERKKVKFVDEMESQEKKQENLKQRKDPKGGLYDYILKDSKWKWLAWKWLLFIRGCYSFSHHPTPDSLQCGERKGFWDDTRNWTTQRMMQSFVMGKVEDRSMPILVDTGATSFTLI